MYCRQCRKEIVFLGIGHGTASSEEIDAMRRSIEDEGKLPLFNPPPVGPYRCPDCHEKLAEEGALPGD
jgi:hypothetical protein